MDSEMMATKKPAAWYRNSSFTILLHSDQMNQEMNNFLSSVENLAKTTVSTAKFVESKPITELPYDDNVMEERFKKFLEDCNITQDYFKNVDCFESELSSNDDEDYNSEKLNELRKLVDSSRNETEDNPENAKKNVNIEKHKKEPGETKNSKKMNEIRRWRMRLGRNKKKLGVNQNTIKVTSHSDRSAICRYKDCRKVFKHSGSLKKHHLIHRDTTRKFACLICTVRCVSSSSLKAHYTINHSGSEDSDPERRLIVCGVCMKRFSSEIRLLKHIENRHH